ncbi:RNA helicase [Synechococcus sp. RSCCF101]|uniref:RNA helicase n=1 Tax=Synechococcus sp. RSCCF101 TaxID=2511069 RepID=UPI001245187F|nr:RNA helicase [Synechococcus sp. RSCCF101]QEY32732.1 RNA helicase [Synechococcus sp. RSCCF101]
MDRFDAARGGRRLDRARSEGRRAADGLARMGRWMGDRLDWLLEDEDDWQEPWQQQDPPAVRSPAPPEPGGRRRLEAISRRQPRARAEAPAPVREPRPTPPAGPDDWPDEDAFRIARWSRDAEPVEPAAPAPRGSDDQPDRPVRRPGPGRRPMPRSSRRRQSP